MTISSPNVETVQNPSTLGVREASDLIDAGALTPLEIMHDIFARIDAVEDTIHAYLRFDREGAFRLAEAATKRALKGERLGPLDGIPFAVKDNIYTANFETTAGSRVPQKHAPSLNATVVSLLQQGGAILLGKLNTWEYGTGTGAVYDDLPNPVARNPWNTDHYTGGSSSGSGAAVAAGTAMFTIGTDTGGSVRLPAAGCGVVGLKPTYGHISRYGIMPNCWSFDTPGPLTASVEDSHLIYTALAHQDDKDAACLPPAREEIEFDLLHDISGLRVGVVTNLDPDKAPPQAEILEALAQSADILEKLGATVVPIEMPLSPSEYRAIAVPINRSESFSIHEQDFLEYRHLMGKALRTKLEVGMYMRATDYIAALRQRSVLVEQTNKLFDEVDVVLLPITYETAPRFDDPEAVARFTTGSAGSPFSLTGHPALSLPISFTKDNIPVSIQMAAGFNQEQALLSCANQVEKALPNRPKRASIKQMIGEQ